MLIKHGSTPYGYHPGLETAITCAIGIGLAGATGLWIGVRIVDAEAGSWGLATSGMLTGGALGAFVPTFAGYLQRMVERQNRARAEPPMDASERGALAGKAIRGGIGITCIALVTESIMQLLGTAPQVEFKDGEPVTASATKDVVRMLCIAVGLWLGSRATNAAMLTRYEAAQQKDGADET